MYNAVIASRPSPPRQFALCLIGSSIPKRLQLPRRRRPRRGGGRALRKQHRRRDSVNKNIVFLDPGARICALFSKQNKPWGGRAVFYDAFRTIENCRPEQQRRARRGYYVGPANGGNDIEFWPQCLRLSFVYNMPTRSPRSRWNTRLKSYKENRAFRARLCNTNSYICEYLNLTWYAL